MFPRSQSVLLLLLALLQASIPVSASVDHESDDVPLKTNFSAYNMAGKYQYIGCYDTGPLFTELPNTVLVAKMSSARCYMYCMDQAYRYFGVRQTFCSCGNTYGTVGAKPQSSCNRTCDLAPSEKCGGADAVSVYAVIERFTSIGCFNQLFDNSTDWKHVGSRCSKMECSLRCQKENAAFFAMRVGHVCYCMSQIDRLVQQASIKCLASCTEADITMCGNHEFMSVYNIHYAKTSDNVLGARIGFLGGQHRVLLTLKSATLFGVVIDRHSKLYFRVHAEDRKGSGNYSQLIGETANETATPCPPDWLSFSLLSNLTTSDRVVRQGYRCYLPVKEGLSWSSALQKCWDYDSDLFYLEDPSEFDFLANSSLGTDKYWIGMFLNTTLNTFTWVEDTTGYAASGRVRSVLQTTGRGCVQLTPLGKIWMADTCSRRIGYICKRFSSLYSGWNAQLTNTIEFGRNVSLTLHESAARAPVLQLNLSLTFGSHTAILSSHPGSRLHYSVTEKVPLKLCHPQPSAGAAYHTCSEVGNVLPRYQFGQYTCANEERLKHGGKWIEPLGDWVEDVSYYVTEVHVFNRLNLNFTLGLISQACQPMRSTDPTWFKFTCNANVKGFTLSAVDKKYPYLNMCDLQVFGYQTMDNSKQDLFGNFNPSDRILDIKVLGIFSQRHGSPITFDDLKSPSNGQGDPSVNRTLVQGPEPLVNDMYVRIYHADKLLEVLHFMSNDYFSVIVKKDQSTDKLLMFNTVKDHRTGDVKPEKSCSVEIAVGNFSCNFADSTVLIIHIKERIHLNSCNQSSQRWPVDYCENAFNLVHVPRHRYGRCAQTDVSDQPWWTAYVHSSFMFEQVVLYANAEQNEWTKNFNISIERTACVTVTNGSAFVKKAFDCHLMGIDITVRALANAISLVVCEVVAFGRPAGCGEYTHTAGDGPCKGRLHSHLNYGAAPYESGMRCMWAIAGGPDQTPMVTFPEFRTAGPKDFVAVYEGRGAGGRLLGTFHGGGARRPKHPWMTVHGVSNFIRGRLSELTVIFVTDRQPPAGANRSVETHRGFTIDILMTTNDFIYRHAATSHPVCRNVAIVQKLMYYCSTRGGINPIITNGYQIGMSMINSKNESLWREQNRTGDEYGSSSFWRHAALRSKRQVSPDLLRTFYCATKADRDNLPYYLRICCCETCSYAFLTSQCMFHYGTPIRTACQIAVSRAYLVLNSG